MSGSIPNGWVLGSIADIAEVNPPGSTVTANDNSLVTFLPMVAVEELSGKIDVTAERPFHEVKKNFTRFRNNDVLFAKITPSMENGKVAVARELRGGVGCGTTEFHVIRAAADVAPDYLRLFLVQSRYRHEAKRNMQGAVGQQRVPADFVRESEIPVAPASEQRRIVSKIDELFSQIDEGEQALQRVEKLVERYRQSVLKAAVMGELTRDWRDARKHAGEPVESGEALLARILKARRAVWETAELAKFKAKGKPPSDERWKQKYKEPEPPDTTDLPELPEGWVWASIDQLSGFVTSGSRGWAKYYSPSGSLFLRVGNMERLSVAIDLAKSQYVDPPVSAEGMRTRTQEHDLVISITADVGMVGVIAGETAGCYVNQHLALVRPVDHHMSNWIAWSVASPVTQGRFNQLKQGATKDGLTLDDVKSIPIALSSENETARCVAMVKESTATATSCYRDVVINAKFSAALRQSILKAAFSGQLVPQNPHDEPASKLLERIAAEHAAAPSLRKRKKKSA